MARIFVEGWDPDYGTPLDQDDALSPAEGSVDTSVENDDWAPIEGSDDGVDRIAFVDGVRRIDARLTLDDPEHGPTPGLVGTFAVGAVVWDRETRRSEVADVRIERWAVLAGGSGEQMPAVDLDPGVGTTRAPGDDPNLLMMALHSKMRDAEGECAETLSAECAVVADGPLKKIREHATVGYVKTHRVTYLEPPQSGVIAELAPGQRSPMFCSPHRPRTPVTPGTCGSRCCRGGIPGRASCGVRRRATLPATRPPRSRTARPPCCRSWRASRTSTLGRPRTSCRSGRSSGSCDTAWATVGSCTGRCGMR